MRNGRSKKKRRKYRPRFKNGVMTKRYKDWREKVLARDQNRCQQCGCGCNARSKLNVHHIIPWSIDKSQRYNVDNGITLCTRAHKAITGREHLFEELFQLIVKLNKNSMTRTSQRT